VSASNEPKVAASLDNVKEHFVVDTELHQGFQLGSLVIELDLGIVIRNGQRYHLAPKAMGVLLYLSSTNGEIVSREKIFTFA
jgi:DNA-binding winged helix-turn-helix (wHTH) protein